MRIHEEETQFRFYASVHIKAMSLYKRLVSLGRNGQDVKGGVVSVAKFAEFRLFGHLCFLWWYSHYESSTFLKTFCLSFHWYSTFRVHPRACRGWQSLFNLQRARWMYYPCSVCVNSCYWRKLAKRIKRKASLKHCQRREL